MSAQTFYQRAHFLLSVNKLSQLPIDNGYEVAFAGRSNAGKSSTLNVVCQQKALARISKSPGRTQLVNLFKLDESRRLVDLPGYGYAKVEHATKQRWEHLLTSYLAKRQCLRGIILLMDIRHPLQKFDRQMLTWTQSLQLPIHLTLTKADKLSKSAGIRQLTYVKSELGRHSASLSIQLFSAKSRVGLDELYEHLNEWFALSST